MHGDKVGLSNFTSHPAPFSSTKGGGLGRI
jgi:hypothetical protein